MITEKQADVCLPLPPELMEHEAGDQPRGYCKCGDAGDLTGGRVKDKAKSSSPALVSEQCLCGQTTRRPRDAAGGIGPRTRDIQSFNRGPVVREVSGRTQWTELVQRDIEVHGMAKRPLFHSLHI